MDVALDAKLSAKFIELERKYQSPAASIRRFCCTYSTDWGGLAASTMAALVQLLEVVPRFGQVG